MMRLSIFVLYCCFYFSVNATENNVANIRFSDPTEGTGITFIMNNSASSEAYSEPATKGGIDCRYIPSGKYGYFKVDDALILPTDSKLIFEITYFDNGNDNFSFQYNASSSKYKAISISKTNSNTWITIKTGLSDAAFANLQNNLADFRISGEAYIRQIIISKGELDPTREIVPVTSGSNYSEFKGKSVTGYQAWFTASESNTGWVHWAGNTRPNVSNFSFEIYPDMNDYPTEMRKQSGFSNLGNGEPATLFSSSEVIDEHFKWMKEAGIDGVALQRFIGDSPYPISNSPLSKPVKVKKAAENNGRIFYVCYDMSSGKDENAWVESIKYDWVFNIEQAYALTSSPAYATVNNKPVVQIWGPGFTSRVGNAAKTIELIQFLQGRGCYVIGGVPANWRTESGDSKPGFMAAYKAYNMISPWTPGRYKNISGSDSFKNNYIVPDKVFCDANNLDYLPVLFPGFAWSNWNTGAPNAFPRLAGEFLWRQAYNIKLSGINQMYFAMFDEYDEGTAIMKAATDWSTIPANQYFLTLSADGIWVSSDFYLRVAGAATAMVKRSEVPTETLTVKHSEGPVYYRNSFEKRYTEYVETEGGLIKSGIFNIDPCFYNPVVLENKNVTLPICEIGIDEPNAKSGKYVLKASGNPVSPGQATYEYKFAEVKIPVVADLQLSFWKKTTNEPGQYVLVDLMFKSGKKLSKLTNYKNNTGLSMDPSAGIGTVGFGWENFTCQIGFGELIGDEITGISIAFDKAASSGSYLAYFDDILISIKKDNSTDIAVLKNNETSPYVSSINQTLCFKNIAINSNVKIYDLSGRLLSDFILNNTEVPANLRKGIYLVKVINKQGVYDQKIIL
jgi:hypothetical protein